MDYQSESTLGLPDYACFLHFSKKGSSGISGDQFILSINSCYPEQDIVTKVEQLH